MVWKTTGVEYEGDWLDSQPHGWGIQQWAVEKGKQRMARNRYVGEFNCGQRNGTGVFV